MNFSSIVPKQPIIPHQPSQTPVKAWGNPNTTTAVTNSWFGCCRRRPTPQVSPSPLRYVAPAAALSFVPESTPEPSQSKHDLRDSIVIILPPEETFVPKLDKPIKTLFPQSVTPRHSTKTEPSSTSTPSPKASINFQTPGTSQRSSINDITDAALPSSSTTPDRRRSSIDSSSAPLSSSTSSCSSTPQMCSKNPREYPNPLNLAAQLQQVADNIQPPFDDDTTWGDDAKVAEDLNPTSEAKSEVKHPNPAPNQSTPNASSLGLVEVKKIDALPKISTSLINKKAAAVMASLIRIIEEIPKEPNIQATKAQSFSNANSNDKLPAPNMDVNEIKHVGPSPEPAPISNTSLSPQGVNIESKAQPKPPLNVKSQDDMETPFDRCQRELRRLQGLMPSQPTHHKPQKVVMSGANVYERQVARNVHNFLHDTSKLPLCNNNTPRAIQRQYRMATSPNYTCIGAHIMIDDAISRGTLSVGGLRRYNQMNNRY